MAPSVIGRVHPGRRRWLLWGILACTFLLVNVYRLSTAVIAEDLMAAFRVTGAQLGTLHAMFFVVYAVMQIPTGVLVDRVGPGRTAAVGAAVMNGGAIWFALAGSYGAALGARLLIGLGGSVIFVSMLRFCASWYGPAEFATMNGVSFAVGGFGGLLATTPFAVVVNRLGWHETVLALGVIGLGLAVVTELTVRDRPPRNVARRLGTAEPGHALTASELRYHLGRALRDRWIWLVSVILFCTSGVYLTLFGLWGIPYVAHVYDTSIQFASLFTLIGGVGAVIGPPAIGWVAGKTGWRTSIVLVGGVVYSVALGSIALVGDPPLVVVGIVYFLVGVLLGAFVITYPIVKDRHPPEASGIALGTINGAGFVGASVMPTFMGWLLDAYWTGDMVAGARVYTETGYRIAFAFAASAGLVTIGCAIWLHYLAGDSGASGSRPPE